MVITKVDIDTNLLYLSLVTKIWYKQFYNFRDYKFTRHENIINCELKVAKETKDENEKVSTDNGIKMFSNSSKRIIWEENSCIVYNSKD